MSGPSFVRPDPAARVVPPQPRTSRERRTVPARPEMARGATTYAERREPEARPGPVSAGRPARGRLVLVGLACAAVATAATLTVTRLADDPGSEAPTQTQAALPAPRSVTAVAARVLPSVVSVQVASGSRVSTGSGFVVRDDLVVTNAHVVGSGQEARVGFDHGATLDARVVGVSRETDVAVLRVDVPGRVRALPLADSSAVRVGNPVIAVGSPLGLSGTVTSGIVSATDRQVRIGTERTSALQTDASINPGNSGGPLIDTRGRVVGLNTSIASLGGGNIGIGFAIPANRLDTVVERLVGP